MSLRFVATFGPVKRVIMERHRAGLAIVPEHDAAYHSRTISVGNMVATLHDNMHSPSTGPIGLQIGNFETMLEITQQPDGPEAFTGDQVL